MNTFSRDLDDGNKAEQYVLEQLKNEGFDCCNDLVKVKKNFKSFDLVDRKSGYSVEVKCDYGSSKTGNIVFEFKSKGVWSGISTTKAIHWVQVYYYKEIGSWVYSKVYTNTLRAYLKSNWQYLKTVSGGDHNQSLLKLVSVSDFVSNFEYIKIN